MLILLFLRFLGQCETIPRSDFALLDFNLFYSPILLSFLLVVPAISYLLLVLRRHVTGRLASRNEVLHHRHFILLRVRNGTHQTLGARLTPFQELNLRWLLLHIDVDLDLAWLLQSRHATTKLLKQ